MARGRRVIDRDGGLRRGHRRARPAVGRLVVGVVAVARRGGRRVGRLSVRRLGVGARRAVGIVGRIDDRRRGHLPVGIVGGRGRGHRRRIVRRRCGRDRPQGLFEGGTHRVGAVEAQGGRLLQRASHRLREGVGHRGRQGLRLAVHDRVGDRHHAVAEEGLAPGEHLVEHHADREEIRTRVDVLAHHLLGAHIGRRAEHLAVHREVGLEGEPGDAEVGDLDRPVREDLDVVGLDVPVDDALRVGVGEPREHGPGDLHRARGLQLALAVDLGAQGASVEVLHRHEQASGVLLDVVHRHDVGVVQPSRRLGLALEPAHPVLRLLGGRAARHVQLLDRDATGHLRVVPLVDDVVRAGDLADDLVLAEGAGRGGAHAGLA